MVYACFTMSVTRDLLDQREAELLQARARAMDEIISPIDRELSEIRRAKAAIEAPEVPGLLRVASGLPAFGDMPVETWTLKQLAVRALSEHFPYGATANQLLAVFKSAYGREIARESLSPQLSRLKDDNIIKLDGKLWKLVRPEREEPPTHGIGGSFVGGSEGVSGAQTSARDQH